MRCAAECLALAPTNQKVPDHAWNWLSKLAIFTAPWDAAAKTTFTCPVIMRKH